MGDSPHGMEFLKRIVAELVGGINKPYLSLLLVYEVDTPSVCGHPYTAMVVYVNILDIIIVDGIFVFAVGHEMGDIAIVIKIEPPTLCAYPHTSALVFGQCVYPG